MAAQALLDGEAEALTRTVVELALAGDTAALKLCLDRLLPARRSRPLSFELGATDTPEGLGMAMSRVLEAVARGEILIDEAKGLMDLLERRKGALLAGGSGAETGGGLLADLAKLVRGDIGSGVPGGG